MHNVDVDILDFLERLEIRNLNPDEEEVSFSCPFSGHLHGDENPSASFNRIKGVWHCHGCKRRGNVVTFLSEYENITPMKASRYIREFYGQGFRVPDGGSIAHELEQYWAREAVPQLHNPEIDEQFADERAVDWHIVEESIEQGKDVPAKLTYMLERGFEASTLCDWKVGFDFQSDRICIPVRGPSGKLIGFKGRAWSSLTKPKYLVLGDKHAGRYGFPTYEKARVVFGLEKIWKQPVGTVIVTEGELDVIALWQAGHKAVACEGSYISDYQETLIKTWADEIVLFFDDDEAGQNATADAIHRFQQHMPVRVVGEHAGDPASLTKTEIDNLVESSTHSVRMMIGI